MSAPVTALGFYFFFQAEDGIRDGHVTGVQTCALPICPLPSAPGTAARPPWRSGRTGRPLPPRAALRGHRRQIGRASCRERVLSSEEVVALRNTGTHYAKATGAGWGEHDTGMEHAKSVRPCITARATLRCPPP